MSFQAARFALIVVLAGACGTGGKPSADSVPLQRGATEDSVRGVVSVEGSEPAVRVMLRSASGDLAVAGPQAAVLSRLNGVEVVARGTTSSGVMTPRSFVVRAVAGEAVLDGQLSEEGDALVLTTAAGERVRLVAAPAGLRAHAGHRVWVRASARSEPEAWRRID